MTLPRKIFRSKKKILEPLELIIAFSIRNLFGFPFGFILFVSFLKFFIPRVSFCTFFYCLKMYKLFWNLNFWTKFFEKPQLIFHIIFRNVLLSVKSNGMGSAQGLVYQRSWKRLQERGIVDQNIDSTEFLVGPFKGIQYIALIAKITFYRVQFGLRSLETVDYLSKSILASRETNDSNACADECPGNRLADPAARTCHNRHLPDRTFHSRRDSTLDCGRRPRKLRLNAETLRRRTSFSSH